MSPSRRAAVLGSPIGHSLSPVLHRAAYEALGLDWSYDALDCDEERLPALFRSVRDALDPPYAGLSLTMPLKSAVLPLLDDLAPSALAVGVVNTVVFADGGAIGHNTDTQGVLRCFDEAGLRGAPESLALLGGGGTARAVVAAVAARGGVVARVLLRDPARGASLRELGTSLGVDVELLPLAAAPEVLGAADIVVNTTPAGAVDALAADPWPRGIPYVDVLYAPWPTPLATAAAAAGAVVVGGLVMLVGQAAVQVELHTGRPAPYDVMRAAGEAALSARSRDDGAGNRS
ncbi:MAG: shikimate dehydrogenase [Frankiaceae bacterium]|nr:shikimate dehydrogenase [Frankiaceae bacterium]